MADPCGIPEQKNPRPRVVIVGAGFGGLWAARGLTGAPADVLLLDRHNYHTFLPMLYQVAAAEVEHEEIVYPVRGILRPGSNVHFLMEDVQRVDFEKREVRTRRQTIPYDYLVLSSGSATHFFGVPGAEEHAFQLKTLDQAVALRNHILFRFERAMCAETAECRRAMLTFAIVGGGPTGIEYAGALSELVRGPLRRDYPGLDFHEVRVLLLEATDHLLTGFAPRLQRYAAEQLQRMGVEVMTGAAVSRITDSLVELKGGAAIPTQTVVWTAGVRADAPTEEDGLPRQRNGQVRVEPTLQAPGHPEVYFIGDLAYTEYPPRPGESAPRPLPMNAPVAIQQGRQAARNIQRQLGGRAPAPFRYNDLGKMVTIGRNAAVAEIAGRGFTGLLAWALWLGVHLFGLIGFRNRVLVMINWAYDYFFFDRTVRLIIPQPPEQDCGG